MQIRISLPYSCTKSNRLSIESALMESEDENLKNVKIQFISNSDFNLRESAIV